MYSAQLQELIRPSHIDVCGLPNDEMFNNPNLHPSLLVAFGLSDSIEQFVINLFPP
jgi:hypothetical protein